MIVFDQFETEPISSYSGSIFSSLTYGTFFDERAKFLRPVIADKSHGIISSSIYNKNITYLMSYLASVVSGSTIGRNQNFVGHFSQDEYIFDSLMSHPLNYSKINGANPIIHNPVFSGSSMFGIPDTALSASAFLVLGTSDSIVSSATGILASDNIWLYSYPFESKYKNVIRYFSTTQVTPEPITTNLSWSSNFGVKDTESPIVVDRIASLDFVTRSFSNADNPNSQGWTFDFTVNSGTINPNGVVIPIDIINKHYFGVGLGPQGMTNVGFYQLYFPNISSIALKVITSPILRGFKYGVYNSNKTQTKTVFRRNSYGNFRDMLEQRQYSKLYNKKNNSVLASPVHIAFISGNISVLAKDYLTASNPAYNPRDSGIFDYEYKSGQPFFDS